MSKPTIGLVGVGNIGSGLASNVIDRNFSLWVRDIRPDQLEPLVRRGAIVADDTATLARECDIILVSLPAPEISRDVVLGPDGLVANARVGLTIVEMSTLNPEIVQEFAAVAKKMRVGFLDCPIMGGKVGADSGTLQATVGGDANVLEKCRPVLETFCSNIVHVGGVGAGQYVKLINNLMDVDAMFLCLDALFLAARAREETGLDLARFYSVLEQGTAASWVWTTYVGNLMRNQPIAARVEVLWKDAKLIADLEREKRAPHQSFQRTLGVASYYMSLGLGKSDFVDLVRRIGKDAGLDMFIHEEESSPDRSQGLSVSVGASEKATH